MNATTEETTALEPCPSCDGRRGRWHYKRRMKRSVFLTCPHCAGFGSVPPAVAAYVRGQREETTQ